MKRILVCTDGSKFSQSSYHYAAWLAHRLDAGVDILHVTDVRSQKVVSTDNFSGTLGLDASRELLDKLVELEHEKARLAHQQSKLILEDAAQFFSGEGIAFNTIHETGFLIDIFHEFESRADAIVLGKRGNGAEFASGHLGSNIERIVRSSHKPCWISSREFKPIDRLLLAYDGSPSSEKMLQFMIDFPVFEGLELHILKVTKHPDDATAVQRLRQAEHKARLAGFDPVCSLLPGHPEKTIATYIEEQDISLLLMGAYGHSRIRHLIVGSTTIQMLRSSHIPVLLFR
ncbi:MAG: universal stress protein [Geitlerinemataceae cyanobacterium]